MSRLQPPDRLRSTFLRHLPFQTGRRKKLIQSQQTGRLLLPMLRRRTRWKMFRQWRQKALVCLPAPAHTVYQPRHRRLSAPLQPPSHPTETRQPMGQRCYVQKSPSPGLYPWEVSFRHDIPAIYSCVKLKIRVCHAGASFHQA